MVRNQTAKRGVVGWITESGRPPGKGNDHLLQHSCWEIPRTEEPGGLQFMGSQKSQT